MTMLYLITNTHNKDGTIKYLTQINAEIVNMTHTSPHTFGTGSLSWGQGGQSMVLTTP